MKLLNILSKRQPCSPPDPPLHFRLVLDEPTNDLDLETLELLEARFLEYQGTVLLVSQDRSFLDNLCTSTLVFEGRGVVKEYVGGYSEPSSPAGRSWRSGAGRGEGERG